MPPPARSLAKRRRRSPIISCKAAWRAGAASSYRGRHDLLHGLRLRCAPAPTGWKWRSSACGTLSTSAACALSRYSNGRMFDLKTGEYTDLTTITARAVGSARPAGGLVMIPSSRLAASAATAANLRRPAAAMSGQIRQPRHGVRVHAADDQTTATTKKNGSNQSRQVRRRRLGRSCRRGQVKYVV